MDLYELSLVVNRIQEKAIREVFTQRNWQYIIAGVKKCEIPRLPPSSVFQDFSSEEVNENASNSKGDQRNLVGTPLSEEGVSEEMEEGRKVEHQINPHTTLSDHDDYVDSFSPMSSFADDSHDPDWDARAEIGKSKLGKGNTKKYNKPHCKGETVPKGVSESPKQKSHDDAVQGLPSEDLTVSDKTGPEPRGVTRKPSAFVEEGSSSPNKMSSDFLAEESDYQCGNCSKSFKTFRELRLHLAQHKRVIEGTKGYEVGQKGQHRLTWKSSVKTDSKAKTSNFKVSDNDAVSSQTNSNQSHPKISTSTRGSLVSMSSVDDNVILADIDKVIRFEKSLLCKSYGEGGPPRRRRGRPRKSWPSQYLAVAGENLERLSETSGPTRTAVSKTVSDETQPPKPVSKRDSGVQMTEAFDCGNCSESFSAFRDLRLHLQKHKAEIEGSKEFYVHRKGLLTPTGQNRQCLTCEKTFPNAAALRVHERVHSGERPYLCNLCGKAFKQMGAFQNHLRTHTGETPFKCNMCDMAYRQLGELQRHKRRHTGEKPQLCTICGKRFAEQSYLKSHMRQHTGEKPFSCHLCDKTFSQRTSLKFHIKTHHRKGVEFEPSASLLQRLAQGSAASILEAHCMSDKSHRLAQGSAASILETHCLSDKSPPKHNTDIQATEAKTPPSATLSQTGNPQLIPMDFSTNTQPVQLNNPSDSDPESRFDLHHSAPQPQFVPADPASSEHLRSFHHSGGVHLPPQPHLVPLDSMANIQSWPYFHPDVNMGGVY